MHFLLALAFILFLTPLSSRSQNLVPNPSFEDHISCPTASRQVDRCLNWMNFGNSPDYFSTCGPANFNLPNLSAGFQFPHTGNFHMGLVLFRKDTSIGANYREFIGAQLSNPTIIGQKYFFSFFCNNSGNLGISSDKIGLKLSTVAYDSCCPPSLTNSAHLYSDTVIVDTTNWTYINGSFIADSTYNFIMIGNFFDDNNTDTINLFQNAFSTNAYYYIDDICVSTDSMFNQTWTGLNTLSNNYIQIFPNPAAETLNILYLKVQDEICIYNQMGQKLDEFVVQAINQRSSFPFYYPSGIYFVTIRHMKKLSTHKIIKL